MLLYLLDRKNQLTDEEKKRDTFGDSYMFMYDPDHKKPYPSSLPGFFPGNASFSKHHDIIYIILF